MAWRAHVGVAVMVLAVAGCSAEVEAGPSSTTATSSSAAPTTTSAIPEKLSLTLTPADKAVDVAPGEPLVLATTGGKVTEVVVTGADGKPVAGAVSTDGGTWKAAEGLGYGKTYTAAVKASDGKGQEAAASSTFTTARPKRQVGVSMNPLDGDKVGIGQPLAFYFDSAIADKAAAEKAIEITSTPAAEGAFYWFSDREAQWRPRVYWTTGTTITINAGVYGKHLGNGTFGRQDRKATVTVGDAVTAVVDGGTHQMTVTVNGAVARTIPISLGKKAHETPVGTYVVMSEHTNYTMDSSTYGVPVDDPRGYRTKVAVATRLSNSGIFYHSAPWSVRDQGQRNVSHGCINMSTENATWLQSISAKGDVIVVQNSGGPVLEPWDGLGVWQIPWETWKLGGKKS